MIYSQQPPSDYDWRLDALKSYQLAIAEKRKAGLLSGRYQPCNEEERAMLATYKPQEAP